jgi:hypothetical protein
MQNQNATSATSKYSTLLPPIITGVIGLIAGVALALVQHSAATDRYFLEHRVTAAEGVAAEFSTYIHHWNRLRTRNHRFRELDKSGSPPSASDIAELKAIAGDRNKARDTLYAHLNKLNLYFKKDVSTLVASFKDWDAQYAVSTLEQLPEIKEWEERQAGILGAIGKELQR